MVKGSNFDKAKIGGPIKQRRIVRFVGLETRTRPSSLHRYKKRAQIVVAERTRGPTYMFFVII